MHNTLALFFALFISVAGYSQRTCYSTQLLQQATESNPVLRKNRQAIQNRINQSNSHNRTLQNVLTIPVVVHVVHDGDPIGSEENLADFRILAQIDQLNADYRRLNSDAINTPAGFQAVAADTQIEFCLVTEDPNGNPSSGILRHMLSDFPNFNPNQCWTGDRISSNIVEPSAWNTSEYLNLYSVSHIDQRRMGCQFDVFLGYASFPGLDPAQDVTVMAYYTFGSIDIPHPDGAPYNLGRTVSHEVGHWLNLDHIWGPFSGGCGEDDGASDTPLQNAPSEECPVFPLFDNCTNAGDGIMFMNYMDYSYDECMNLFTKDQADIMMATLNTARMGLLFNKCAGEICPDTLIVNTNNLSGLYQAKESIISNVILPSPDSITYSTEGTICLENGFEIQLGTYFESIDAACPN